MQTVGIDMSKFVRIVEPTEYCYTKWKVSCQKAFGKHSIIFMYNDKCRITHAMYENRIVGRFFHEHNHGVHKARGNYISKLVRKSKVILKKLK